MTSLRQDISEHTLSIPVTAPLVNPTYPLFRTIGSETIKVIGSADTTEWQVERGIGDTQAAPHGKGAALIADTTPYGAGGDAGEQTVYVQPTDPGAVGAGKGWVKDDEDPPVLRLRNADDDGWDVQGGGVAVLADPGNVWEAETAVAEGYRILAGVDEEKIFEALSSGETGTEEPDFDAVAPDGGTTADGTVASWDFIGYLSRLPFEVHQQAAFVANGSTVDQLRDSLIAAGFMRSS